MAVFIGGIGATKENKGSSLYYYILQKLERDGYFEIDRKSESGFRAYAYTDINNYTIVTYEPKMKDDYKTYKSKYSWAKALVRISKKTI